MDVNYYKQYEPIFGAWKIKEKLGEGNFGAVYEIEREDFGTTYKAALKTITIPKNQAELESILDDGMDATSAEEYLQQFVEKIVSEFVLMSKLKGNSHIVSYEDHQVIKHKNGIGWDILIRMELLTPMMSYMKTNSITRRDVIKLGIDMCRALELCQKYNIIHRDIKPENIFISDSGDFKLGDFGIAKEVEKTQSGLTKTGTQTYMAPEVYKGQPYGSSVDMYSLGVVLYRLLNHNRAPFMPQYPNPISYSDRERALIMRMGGHKFPSPSGVEEGCRLAEIAMRACSFNPDDRYSSPTQMREDLEAILYTEGEGILMFPTGDSLDIKSVNYVSSSKNPNRTQWIGDEATEVIGDDATEVMDYGNKPVTKTARKNTKSSLKFIIPAAVLGVAVAVGAILATNNKKALPTVAVTSVQELTDPIEFKLESPSLSDEDYNILTNRLEAFGKKYYFDKGSNTIVISKADLGRDTQEILATINMLTGKGEVLVSDPENTSEYRLTNADFEKSLFTYDESGSRIELITKESEREKLDNLISQVIASEMKELSVSVDGNTRFSIPLTDQEFDGKIVISEKENETVSDYMKIVNSCINDGTLSNSYQIYIDEKYGLKLSDDEPEANILEETENVGETITEETHETNKASVSTNKVTNNKKSSSEKQQSVSQTPTQKQTEQQAPVQQNQQQSAPSTGNSAGMPEVYIDFD